MNNNNNNNKQVNNNKTDYLPVVPKTATALVDGSMICMGDVKITALRCVRNLGVIIDRHLNFKEHILSIMSECSFPLLHINEMSCYHTVTIKKCVVNAIILHHGLTIIILN